METLTERAAIAAAARDPTLDKWLRAVLRLRFEQMGGAGAEFHVADPTDTVADAEAAVGWPMTDDEQPQWEWARRHPGEWTEVTFILSDDGPAQVLLVPDGSPVAALVLAHAN